LDDIEAPLLDAWRRFTDSDVMPFTIPGHKRRAGQLWPTLGRVLDGDVPLFAGLGTVQHAVADLAEAERLAADLWSADWCRFSVGGSTHANQAAALAVGRPGETVLVSRTAHRSTLSGLILAGVHPVWLPTEVDPRLNLPLGVSLRVLEQELAAHPDAAAVFLVEPSYVGSLSDLERAIALAHAHDVPVVVDQAWGAHFGFHPAYPPHALQLDADVMIISAHKTLPSYSQAAVIAARTDRINAARLDRAFDVGATTSPAGSILASIDASRAVLASGTGRDLLAQLLNTVDLVRRELHAAGIATAGPQDFPTGRFDPAKLVLLLDTVDGLAVEQALIEAGVPVEQADHGTLVAIVTMLDDATTVGRLVRAVAKAVADAPPAPPPQARLWTAQIPPAAMSPRDAFFARHEVVSAQHAIGRTSAELIAPYPPGIPLLAPGELITPEVIEALTSAAASGIRIAYARDASLSSYEVVVE
jgi:arginine decarboxylase